MNFIQFHPIHVYHPPVSALPPGFVYPKAYLDYVSRETVPNLDPWWFLCHSQDTGSYGRWMDILKEQFPSRKLVPFAKWGLDDEIACFEHSDNPELPAIHYIKSFVEPGCEERGYCATFEEWLQVSLEEAEGYQADNPVDEDFEEQYWAHYMLLVVEEERRKAPRRWFW